MRRDKFQAGFGLIEIILVLAVCLFLYYTITKIYLEKPQISRGVKKMLSEEGISTTNYRSIIDTVKKKLNDSQTQNQDQ